MTAAVNLTDAELLLLDGRCSDDVQKAVDLAKARSVQAASHPDLTPAEVALLTKVLHEAKTHGRLVWQFRNTRSCSLCDKTYDFHRYKSGPRRGERNTSKPKMHRGVELAPRFVTFQGSVTVGGCVECMERMAPVIAAAIEAEGLRVQLPPRLIAEMPDAQRWVKDPHRECQACGWTGGESEMGKRRTMFGDGWYPAECPSCGEANVGLGRTVIKTVDGFTMREVTP